jgi:Kef-type K+ transport system membrane component KefB
MSSILLVGIIVFTGFVAGEGARKVGLPKVTGFLLAGVLLNPSVTGFISQDFVYHTDLVTNIALSFITFSVGGTLLLSRVKALGKSIMSITLFEAESAFLVVLIGVLLVAPLVIHVEGATWAGTFIPAALMIACLASPTDPSATLAVVHEYKAEGKVTSTILGAAAFDDVLGIINYSVAIALAQALAHHDRLSISSAVLTPVVAIGGAIGLGAAFGFGFSLFLRLLSRETEGALIVAVLAMLCLCFGVASRIGVDELLSTMTMGMVVVNYSPLREKVFKILERYTEELIFVLFFTLSGMHLGFSTLAQNLPLVVLFVLLRTLGKVVGTLVGGRLAGMSNTVTKYVAGGLLPQGGIVVGLALLMRQNEALADISGTIISVIIGATVLHEIGGPIVAKAAIKAAGEIPGHR